MTLNGSTAAAEDSGRDRYWTEGCGADVLNRDQAISLADTAMRAVGWRPGSEGWAAEWPVAYAAACRELGVPQC